MKENVLIALIRRNQVLKHTVDDELVADWIFLTGILALTPAFIDIWTDPLNVALDQTFARQSAIARWHHVEIKAGAARVATALLCRQRCLAFSDRFEIAGRDAGIEQARLAKVKARLYVGECAAGDRGIANRLAGRLLWQLQARNQLPTGR